MKKLHGVYSIQDLTIKDISVADDAAIQEHKLLLDYGTAGLDIRIATLENLLGDLSDLSEIVARVARLEAHVYYSPSFTLTPEYPSSTLTSLGEMEVKGEMHVDYDSTAEKTYFEWISNEPTEQYYGVVLKHWFPKSLLPLIWESGYLDLRIIGSGSVTMTVKKEGSTLFSHVYSDTAGGWHRFPFNSTELATLNAETQWDDGFTVEFKLGAYDGGSVNLSTFSGTVKYGS